MFDRLHMMFGEGTAPTPAPTKTGTQATPEGVAFAAEYATQFVEQTEASKPPNPITEGQHLGLAEFNLAGSQFTQTPSLTNPLGLPLEGAITSPIDTQQHAPNLLPTEALPVTPQAGSIVQAEPRLSAPAAGEIFTPSPTITHTVRAGALAQPNAALPVAANSLPHGGHHQTETSDLAGQSDPLRPTLPTTPETDAVLDARVSRLTRPIADGEVPHAPAHFSTTAANSGLELGPLKHSQSGVKTPAHNSASAIAVAPPVSAPRVDMTSSNARSISNVQTGSSAHVQIGLTEAGLELTQMSAPQARADTPITPQTETLERQTTPEAPLLDTRKSTPNPPTDDVRLESPPLSDSPKTEAPKLAQATAVENPASVTTVAVQVEGSTGTKRSDPGSIGQAQIRPAAEASPVRKPERTREPIPADVRLTASADVEIKTPQASPPTAVNNTQSGSIELASSTAPLGLSPLSSSPQGVSPLSTGVVLTPSAPIVQPPTLVASPAEVPQIISQSLAQNEATERITIQLDPPELGRVAIDFQIDENGVHTVTITGENNEAIRKLRLMNFELLQALEQQGMAGRGFSLEYQSSDRAQDWAEAETGPGEDNEAEADQQTTSQPYHQPNALESRSLALAGRGLNLRV